MRGNPEVVVNDLSFGDFSLGKEHLIQIGYGHVLPVYDDVLFPHRHTYSPFKGFRGRPAFSLRDCLPEGRSCGPSQLLRLKARPSLTRAASAPPFPRPK